MIRLELKVSVTCFYESTTDMLTAEFLKPANEFVLITSFSQLMLQNYSVGEEHWGDVNCQWLVNWSSEKLIFKFAFKNWSICWDVDGRLLRKTAGTVFVHYGVSGLKTVPWPRFWTCSDDVRVRYSDTSLLCINIHSFHCTRSLMDNRCSCLNGGIILSDGATPATGHAAALSTCWYNLTWW